MATLEQQIHTGVGGVINLPYVSMRRIIMPENIIDIYSKDAGKSEIVWNSQYCIEEWEAT